SRHVPHFVVRECSPRTIKKLHRECHSVASRVGDEGGLAVPFEVPRLRFDPALFRGSDAGAAAARANLNLRSASNGYRRTIQFASEFSELSTPLKRRRQYPDRCAYRIARAPVIPGRQGLGSAPIN